MITIFADDLSGAQEAFAAASGLTKDHSALAGMILLDPAAMEAGGTEVLALDLQVRGAAVDAASEALVDALKRLGPAGRAEGRVLVKVDSLLRGPVGSLVEAAATVGPVVFCPAVPALGRTVEDGRLRVRGVPLEQTDLWDLERTAVPASIAEMLGARRSELLGLETVRGPGLAEQLAVAAARSQILIVDAVTDADCDAIAQAALGVGAVLVGAAGIARAVGGRVGGAAAPEPQRSPVPREAPVAVVVGSGASTAREQVAVLETLDVPVHRWRPERALGALDEDAVLVLDAPRDPERADELNAGFARAVADSVGGHHLVLTGGQTARTVLELLDVHVLHPFGQPHHGAVVAITGSGRLIATRPGSFGDSDSLRTLRSALHRAQRPFTRGPSI